MTTVVDLVSAQEGHFREVVTPSLRHIDVLFLNEYEAGHLLGEELLEPDAERLIDAGQKILRMGVRCGVVLHCPEMGVAVQANGDPVVHGAVVMHPDDIKGAAGAGDAFAAGMLFGLHEGEPLARCLKMAVCSAASCLTDPTTSMGVKCIDECLEMGENFGFRHES